jgi:hypothetical protein
MDWPSMAVGGAGVLLGAISLTWQAVTFRLTGSKVVAELRVGVVVEVPGIFQGRGGVLTCPPNAGWERRVADLRGQYGGTPVLALVASNVGRLAVGMEGAAAVTESGIRIQPDAWAINPAPGATCATRGRACFCQTTRHIGGFV